MTWIDYLVFWPTYFISTTAIGLHFGKGQRSGLTYFLGDRSIHWLPAGITHYGGERQYDHFHRDARPVLQVGLDLPADLHGHSLACWIVSVLFLPISTRVSRSSRLMSFWSIASMSRHVCSPARCFNSSSAGQPGRDLCPCNHAL